MECRKCEGQGFVWIDVDTGDYRGTIRDYCERCEGKGSVTPQPEEDE